MYIYIILFGLLIMNMYVFKGKCKTFVIFTFLELFLVAALRNYTVGIDLKGHYAKNYINFGNMEWIKIFELIEKNNSFYDSGLILFMKVLSTFVKHRQFFIIITSAITYGLVGRYIYKHSKNVYLETFIFFTAYTYFMYMNIIAQALAIAIILFSIDFLENKKIVQFVLLTLLANCIHSSAIIALIFIPLRYLKINKQKLRLLILGILIFMVSFDTVIPIIVENIFPQFAYYFEGDEVNKIDKLQLVYVIFYGIMFLFSFIINYGVSENLKRKEFDFENLKSVFFVSAILAVLIRYLGMSVYIFSRMGFYFYLFAHTMFVSSIEQIKDNRLRGYTKVFAYIGLFVFFVVLTKTLKVSYGVVPYKFFYND